MSPPEKQNGPGGVATPTRAEKNKTADQTARSVATVQLGADRSTASEQTTLDGVPAAFASVYAPCPGRTRWLAIYVCPVCSLGHAGYAREADKIPGLRRARCGRPVWLVVTRTYRGASEVAA